MAVKLKIPFFWHVIQYRLIYSYRRFEESKCLRLEGQRLELLDPEDEFTKTVRKFVLVTSQQGAMLEDLISNLQF